MKYKIAITFETGEPLPKAILDAISAACFAQIEGLQDDLGVPYTNAQMTAGSVPKHGKLRVKLSPNEMETIGLALKCLEKNSFSGEPIPKRHASIREAMRLAGS